MLSSSKYDDQFFYKISWFLHICKPIPILVFTLLYWTFLSILTLTLIYIFDSYFLYNTASRINTLLMLIYLGSRMRLQPNYFFEYFDWCQIREAQGIFFGILLSFDVDWQPVSIDDYSRTLSSINQPIPRIRNYS